MLTYFNSTLEIEHKNAAFQSKIEEYNKLLKQKKQLEGGELSNSEDEEDDKKNYEENSFQKVD